MELLIAFALAVATAGVQEKTYDLTIEYKPAPGLKIERTKSQFAKVIMRAGDRTVAKIENFNVFAVSEEILSVDSDRIQRRWTITKAMRRVDGKTVPYSFQGKGMKVTTAKGKDPEFALEEGGTLSPDDRKGLYGFIGRSEGEKPGGPDPIAPGRRIKAGETWNLDVKRAVPWIFDEDLAKAVDASKSKISFTLKSVEARGGAEFGKISAAFELMLGEFGGLKLERQVPIVCLGELDVCVDGTRPDGDLKLRGEMIGKSIVKTDRGDVEVEIDFTMKAEKSIKTLK